MIVNFFNHLLFIPKKCPYKGLFLTNIVELVNKIIPKKYYLYNNIFSNQLGEWLLS